jgi:lipoyl(octanoyl) transferase
MGSRLHIGADDDELRERGIALRWVNRGGGCVLHLPGQVSAYFLYPLLSGPMTVMAYVDRLHEVIVKVLGEFDLRGQTREDSAGVFLGNSRVATVGVAVKRWIAYHGLTLNVGAYLEPFHVLEEPGPFGLPVRYTSMESQRQRPAPMSKVRESLIRQIEGTFGLERHHIYTDHALLQRKSGRHVVSQRAG